MYNCKVIHYKDHDQVRLYSKLFSKSFSVDEETGEFLQKAVSVFDGSVKNETDYGVTPWGDKVEGILEEKECFFDKERSAKISMNRSISEVYSLSRSNSWEWFFTLTFSPDKVDRYDYKECSSKVSQWLRNIRKRYAPDMVYLVVPELHQDGAYHFHGLFRDIGELPLLDSGHKDNQGRIIYNIGSYHFGFTTVTAVGDSSRASSYLSKYITKELCAVTFNKKRYWCSKNINRATETTLMVEGSFLEKLRQVGQDVNYVKTVTSDYVTVTYLELNGRFADLEGE